MKVLVLDVKVLVLDVKVLVLEVKVLLSGPGCKITGPRMWKYWSLDVSNCVRKCCRKVRNMFKTNESLQLIVMTKL